MEQPFLIAQIAGHTVVQRTEVIPYCNVAWLPLKTHLNLGNLGLLNRLLDEMLPLLGGVAVYTLGIAVADKQA